MSKPEPIRVGVEGFNAFAAKLASAPQPYVDVTRLGELPVFQMFLAERHPEKKHLQMPESRIYDHQKWLIHALELNQLYPEYCSWHEAKGYWPNETPLGEIKG